MPSSTGNPLVGYAVDMYGRPVGGYDLGTAQSAPASGTANALASSSGRSFDRFPNVATISDYFGVNPALTQMALMAVPGVAGMALGALNTVGNIANTTKNADLLASMGSPLNAGQRFGGYLGLNGYNGFGQTAINSAQSSLSTTPMGHLGLDLYGYGGAGDFSTMEKAAGTVNGINADTNPTGAGTGGVMGLGGTLGDITSGGFGGGDGPSADISGANSAGTDHAEDGGAQADGFAKGGVVPGRSKGGASGPVGGATGGTADAVQADVPGGAYVLPANVVAALGGGNSDAGLQRLAAAFPSQGGNPLVGQPVRVSAGEFVIAPHFVEALGGPKALEKLSRDVLLRAAQAMKDQAKAA